MKALVYDAVVGMSTCEHFSKRFGKIRRSLNHEVAM